MMKPRQGRHIQEMTLPTELGFDWGGIYKYVAPTALEKFGHMQNATIRLEGGRIGA
jgi:hypothetical protein